MMLNDEQLAVVNSTATRILCLAGAGAGKTKTLIARLMRLIDDDVRAEEILVLTFTRAAALEMQHRFNAATDSAAAPNFKTFHAFCYEVLCNDFEVRMKLGYSSVPSVLSDIEEKQTILRISKQSGLPHTLLTKKKLTSREQTNRAILVRAVDKAFKSENLITYDMLADNVSKLFIANEACIQKYKKQYKHIFVDEFQDTDTFQAKFVESFKDSSIFVVGDVLQNIYSFRGTTSEVIKGYAKSDTWTKFYLHNNYRSTKQICEYANEFSQYADDAFRISMEAVRDGEDVHTITFPMTHYGTAMSQMETCHQIVQMCHGSTAILARTNKEAEGIATFLNGFGVCVYHKSDKLKCILSAVSDDEHMIQWLTSTLTGTKYIQYLQQISIHPDADKVDILRSIGYSSDIDTILYLRDCLKKDEYAEFIDIASVYNHQIVIDNVESIESSNDFIAALNTAAEPNSNDVYVGTIHSVKGLEFDNVIVVGANGPTFKLNSEDNKNLFYVGITRAKNRLWVFTKEE